MKDDCIFCKLANGVIPTRSIYEDDDFKVIMDADPATKGHVLILPKEHFNDLLDCSDEVAKKIMPLAKKIAIKQKETLSCDGINIVQNTGQAAGQTVFHLHVHIIPRYKEKEPILTWTHESFTDEEFEQIKQAISL